MIKVGRLEKTTHTLLALQFRIFDGLLGIFSVLSVEFGIIASELLQADEEVAQVGLELGDVVVVEEQALDELPDLNAVPNGSVTWLSARTFDLRLQVREGVLQEVRDKVSQEIFVRSTLLRLFG